MRQDKIFARILLIFSIANVAIAAPAAVRQRHLDVAKAASEKRASGSGDGETSNLQPDSSPGITPHENPTDDWAWFHRLSSQPDVPESSSAAANRIGTQSPGESGLDDGAAGGSPPESGLHVPAQNEPSDEWVWKHDWTTPPRTPQPSVDHITVATPSSVSASDSAHWGELDPLVPHLGYSPAGSWTSSASGADFREPFEHHVKVAAGALAAVTGALAIAYGIHLWNNHHRYVSLLSPAVI
jgi:hypothetical protein